MHRGDVFSGQVYSGWPWTWLEMRPGLFQKHYAPSDGMLVCCLFFSGLVIRSNFIDNFCIYPHFLNLTKLFRAFPKILWKMKSSKSHYSYFQVQFVDNFRYFVNIFKSNLKYFHESNKKWVWWIYQDRKNILEIIF